MMNSVDSWKKAVKVGQNLWVNSAHQMKSVAGWNGKIKNEAKITLCNIKSLWSNC